MTPIEVHTSFFLLPDFFFFSFLNFKMLSHSALTRSWIIKLLILCEQRLLQSWSRPFPNSPTRRAYGLCKTAIVHLTSFTSHDWSWRCSVVIVIQPSKSPTCISFPTWYITRGEAYYQLFSSLRLLVRLYPFHILMCMLTVRNVARRGEHICYWSVVHLVLPVVLWVLSLLRVSLHSPIEYVLNLAHGADIIEEILSEEIVDEIDRYEDNQSKNARNVSLPRQLCGGKFPLCTHRLLFTQLGIQNRWTSTGSFYRRPNAFIRA